MTSALARSPSKSPSAPTMIDFPAPVSPVRTLNPGASGEASDSMIAKFRIRSSLSIPHRLLAFRVSLGEPSPSQLLPERREERRAGEPNDQHVAFGAPNAERLTAGKRGSHLAVDGHEQL